MNKKKTNGTLNTSYVNTSNIRVGDIAKNYKELCEMLGEEFRSGGDARSSHLKNLQMYFSFYKEGHKFVITDIFDTPKQREDGRSEGNNTVDYIDKIEFLLLDMLKDKDDNESLLLSKNKALKELGIINKNYLTAKYNRGRLSSDIDISIEEIHDFYQSSDSLLYRNIEVALNRLKEKSLIILEKTMTVGHAKTVGALNKNSELRAVKEMIIDDYGDESIDVYGENVFSFIDHRRATKEEKDAILDTEQKVLELYNYETPRDAFLEGKLKNFYENVTDILFENYNIYMYYMSFEITFNKEAIIKYLDNNKDIHNTKDTKNSVNVDVMDRLENNAKNRNEKAISDSFGINFKKRKVIMRSSLNYLANHSELVESLINNETAEYKI